jgi:FkbM family methyltransferase
MKKVVKRIFRQFGYAVVKEIDSIDLQTTLKSLSKKKEIKVIYDIGANNGKYGMKNLRAIFPTALIYAFEANHVHFPYPVGLYNSAFQVCLSDKDNVELDFFMNNTTGDSFFQEATPYYENIKPTPVSTLTLDSTRQELSIPEPDLIKIDVQGAELLILQGAVHTIKNTRYLILELSLFEYNLNAPKISEILSFLEEQSFYPTKIVEQHLIDTVIIQIDLLFERRKRPL